MAPVSLETFLQSSSSKGTDAFYVLVDQFCGDLTQFTHVSGFSSDFMSNLWEFNNEIKRYNFLVNANGTRTAEGSDGQFLMSQPVWQNVRDKLWVLVQSAWALFLSQANFAWQAHMKSQLGLFCKNKVGDHFLQFISCMRANFNLFNVECQRDVVTKIRNCIPNYFAAPPADVKGTVKGCCIHLFNVLQQELVDVQCMSALIKEHPKAFLWFVSNAFQFSEISTFFEHLLDVTSEPFWKELTQKLLGDEPLVGSHALLVEHFQALAPQAAVHVHGAHLFKFMVDLVDAVMGVPAPAPANKDTAISISSDTDTSSTEHDTAAAAEHDYALNYPATKTYFVNANEEANEQGSEGSSSGVESDNDNDNDNKATPTPTPKPQKLPMGKSKPKPKPKPKVTPTVSTKAPTMDLPYESDGDSYFDSSSSSEEEPHWDLKQPEPTLKRTHSSESENNRRKKQKKVKSSK